jgi:hypothetical protein
VSVFLCTKLPVPLYSDVVNFHGLYDVQHQKRGGSLNPRLPPIQGLYSVDTQCDVSNSFFPLFKFSFGLYKSKYHNVTYERILIHEEQSDSENQSDLSNPEITDEEKIR